MKQLFAVFGCGWGGEYLQTFGNVIGSGRLIYKGASIKQALKALRKQQNFIKKLRKQPGMQNAADTFKIYQYGERGWTHANL